MRAPLVHLGYTVLLMLLAPTVARGQDTERVIIRGTVVDADSATALPSVHLRVKNTPLGGVTDGQGRFNTRVSPTDTVVFTRVGYAPFTLVPADSTEASLRELVIRMTPQVTVLEEVRFRDYGDITKYIRREYDSTVDMRQPKGEPLFEKTEPKERRAVGVGAGPNGARLEGAVTAFANLFNDEFQQKKKVAELEAAEKAQAQQRAVHRAMTERYHTLVLATVDLDSTDLQRFTDLYMPPPMVMADMTDYEVTAGIVEALGHFETQSMFLQGVLENGTFEKDNKP